ncbi:MULE domain-containing protein, partial [Aphis craccivora]
RHVHFRKCYIYLLTFIWAKSSSSLLRTTNACESFHYHFKDNLYKEKPNIFKWLNIMKQIQTYNYCSIKSIHTPKKSKDTEQTNIVFLYFTLYYTKI